MCVCGVHIGPDVLPDRNALLGHPRTWSKGMQDGPMGTDGWRWCGCGGRNGYPLASPERKGVPGAAEEAAGQQDGLSRLGRPRHQAQDSDLVTVIDAPAGFASTSAGSSWHEGSENTDADRLPPRQTSTDMDDLDDLDEPQGAGPTWRQNVRYGAGAVSRQDPGGWWRQDRLMLPYTLVEDRHGGSVGYTVSLLG